MVISVVLFLFSSPCYTFSVPVFARYRYTCLSTQHPFVANLPFYPPLSHSEACKRHLPFFMGCVAHANSEVYPAPQRNKRERNCTSFRRRFRYQYYYQIGCAFGGCVIGRSFRQGSVDLLPHGMNDLHEPHRRCSCVPGCLSHGGLVINRGDTALSSRLLHGQGRRRHQLPFCFLHDAYRHVDRRGDDPVKLGEFVSAVCRTMRQNPWRIGIRELSNIFLPD